MTHDPLCPDGLSIEHCCQVVAEIRSDERAAALRDAVEAIKAFGALSQYRKELGDDGYPIFWLEPVDAVAAIEALGGE